VKALLLLNVLITCLCLGESAVLFETDFSELPAGWVSDDNWGFGSFGAALCVSVQDTTWAGEFSTEGVPPVRYFVPDGTDSVVIEVDHWVFLSSGNVLSDASSTAMIELWTSQSGWGDYVFYQSVTDTLFVQEMVSTFVLDSIPPDTFLGFLFRGELVSESQSDYAEIIWQVNGMTVTAYGNLLELNRSTWGSIKAGFPGI
jgi:hypothetical protein